MAGLMDGNKLPALLKDSLDKSAHIWVRIVGKSMLPFLNDGTSLAVRKVEIKDIRIGDIALFRKGDIAIAHRVIKKVNLDGHIFLRAKSDISFLSEPLISDEELIGKVVTFKRFGKEIKIDNFIFRFLGLCVGFLFPIIARAHFRLKSAVSYAVQS